MANRIVFLDPGELEQLLAARRVDEREIESAAVHLAEPDPAVVIPRSAVTRDQIAHVAAYLHVPSGLAVVPDPIWNALAQGHPASRAMYWHEYQELSAYGSLGIGNPFELDRLGAAYWSAHAMACWEEAQYWDAWARSQREDLGAPAFFRAHPLREREIRALESYLEVPWGISLVRSAAEEERRARTFYAAKQLSREEILKWK